MKICIFGAGNIGRSFVARVFSAAGYEVVFFDVDRTVIDALNHRRSYQVVEKSSSGEEHISTVTPVRGVHTGDTLAVERELAGCTVTATAVGGGAFPAVLDAIAGTLAARTGPLDLIMAENIHGAAHIARERLRSTGVSPEVLETGIGLVETSIGKMVPIMPDAVRRRDPLLCWAEPYNTLIVDAHGFRNAIPAVPDLQAVSPITPWVERKLYIHNMGHAAAAYMGHRRTPDVPYLWQLLEDPATSRETRAAMQCSAEALATLYPEVFTRHQLDDHVDDLLQRFRNRALGDTVYRVGRDLRRKLHRDDRIVGAVRSALRAGVDPAPIVAVFHAAPWFAATAEDGTRLPGDQEILERVQREGTRWVIDEIVQPDATLREVLEAGNA